MDVTNLPRIPLELEVSPLAMDQLAAINMIFDNAAPVVDRLLEKISDGHLVGLYTNSEPLCETQLNIRVVTRGSLFFIVSLHPLEQEDDIVHRVHVLVIGAGLQGAIE